MNNKRPLKEEELLQEIENLSEIEYLSDDNGDDGWETDFESWEGIICW